MVDVIDGDPPIQLTAKAKSKVLMAIPHSKLMAKANSKMSMVIPLVQNAGEDKVHDIKVGGKAPCRNAG